MEMMINRNDNLTFQNEERPSRCSETVMFSRFLRTVQRPRKVFLFFGGQTMNKKEKQLKLIRLINQRIKLKKTIYADSHGESKEDVLRALDDLIEKRTVELRSCE